MPEPLFELDARTRVIVLEAMREVAACRWWGLIAAHVRSRHVHVVVDTDGLPARAMGDFKAYATRRMIEQGIEPHRRRRWARSGHASRRWIALPHGLRSPTSSKSKVNRWRSTGIPSGPAESIPAPGQSRAFVASPG